MDYKVLLHFLSPARVFLSSSVMLVGHISHFKLIHDRFMQLQSNLSLRILSVDFIGQFDKPMKVLCLSFTHPIATIDKRGLDHLQFLSRDGREVGVNVLDDKIL